MNAFQFNRPVRIFMDFIKTDKLANRGYKNALQFHKETGWPTRKWST
jgi:hypothetical protein